VKGLVDEGMRPNAFCIEKWDGTGDVNEWLNERERFWIAYYRSEGCTLTNLTDGGMGLSGMKRPPEFGQLMSEKLKGRKFSDESRRRMSEGQKKREKKTPASAFQNGHRPWNREKKDCFSEETREKMRQAKLGKSNPRYNPDLHGERK
jgi:hypothetical protein